MENTESRNSENFKQDKSKTKIDQSLQELLNTKK